MKRLRILHLGFNGPGDGTRSVDDAALAHLQGLSDLERLDLADANVGDAGLAHLSQLKKLQSLNLWGCGQVTDAGLEHLKELPTLRTLGTRGTKVTPAGIKRLQKALPELKWEQ